MEISAAATENSKKTVVYSPSRYNHFFQGEDGGVLAYNAFSNSMARVNAQNYDLIKKILKNPNHRDDDVSIAEFDKLRTDLIRGGFLIDSTLNEFEVLKTQNLVGRFANRALSLTIAPTLSCNFRCSYCFETPKNDTMTREVEEGMLRFVDKQLKYLKELHLSYFGGEPLLKIDMIERLASGFRKLCKKHDAVLKPASIITNGYLLNKDMAIRLKNAGIESVQITIDGTQAVHDRRRKLVNGKGTFQRILENIKAVADILRVVVRINVDKENTGKMDQFYETWNKEGLKDKVTFYFGHIQANTAACMDIASQCLTTETFSRKIVDFLIEAKTHGIWNIQYPSLAKTGFCMADNLNGYVIAPSGFIFKCWQEISEDREYSVGNVLEEALKPSQIMNNTKYLNWDAFGLSECRDCDVFPVCGRGCVYNGLNSEENKDCRFWKYNLRDMLFLKYDEINQKKGV